MLPIFEINSDLWHFQSDIHDNFVEQIGWEELAKNIGGIYYEASATNSSLGILAGNYGEAAAINLYGEGDNLPPVISPVNSYWYRSLLESPPEAVIVVGFNRERLQKWFNECELVGQNGNIYGVSNEESEFHPDIFLCLRPLLLWEAIWPEAQSFG
jgi:hypothetical protein